MGKLNSREVKLLAENCCVFSVYMTSLDYAQILILENSVPIKTGHIKLNFYVYLKKEVSCRVRNCQ